MNTLPTRLIDRAECGAEVVTLRFERPEGYDFVAGQYAQLQIQGPEGPISKPFTIAAAPGDDWLEFTTRLSPSIFKQTLARLEPADPAAVSLPAGRLVLPDSAKQLVFLVGGVGITPARSILRDAAQRSRDLEALVFYGNRDEGCIPYREELESWGTRGVRVIHVLEHVTHEWSGESGFITADVVRRNGMPEPGTTWIAAGPPVMVEAMERVLDELAIPAEERMIERFAGYA